MTTGYDPNQRPDKFGTMTFDEWDDLKSKSSMVRDFENIGPVVLKPKNTNLNFKLSINDGVYYWIGFVVGITIGLIIGVML